MLQFKQKIRIDLSKFTSENTKAARVDASENTKAARVDATTHMY